MIHNIILILLESEKNNSAWVEEVFLFLEKSIGEQLAGCGRTVAELLRKSWWVRLHFCIFKVKHAVMKHAALQI